MVVICEECGKVYKLDAEKLRKSMKGKTSKIKCKVCDHVIQVNLPEEGEEGPGGENIQTVSFGQPSTNDEADSDTPENNDLDSNESQVSQEEPETVVANKQPADKTKKEKKSGGMGLRKKMSFLFLIIPLTLMAGSSVFTQIQMLNLAKNITHKSTDVVKQLAEQSIIDKAKSVASQCSIFLKNNPDLNKDDFYYDFDMKRISIQKVGKGGSTSLIEIYDNDEGSNKFVIWCHQNPDYIGERLLPTYMEALGPSYNKFKGLVSSLIKGKSSSGYYVWKDEKNRTKEKFCAIEPIEQTPYIIISSTFIEDFTTPIINLEKESKKMTRETRNYTILILIVILLLILTFIVIYGYRLTSSIHKLTDAADRISVGELDVQIDIQSQDEIGALADAISRMQDSLRFSIERLRRRR